MRPLTILSLLVLVCLSSACDNSTEPVFGGLLLTVVNENAEPIQGATVTLQQSGETKTTEANGEVTFTKLDPGEYLLEIQAADYEDYLITIQITGNQTSEQTVTLTNEKGSILFQITDSDLNPVQGASITIQPEDSTRTTDANGETTFTSLRVGSHSYSITSSQYQDSDGSVTVTANETSIEEVALTLKNGFVSVSVLDENSNPVSGAHVTLLPDNIRAIATQNGLATLNGVPPGEYTCLVQASIFVDQSDTLIVRPDDTTYETITITAGPLINTKIAFVSWNGGDPNIWVMDPDGSDMVLLDLHIAEDYHPSWSSDATRIAFHSFRYNGSAAEICVMNADGSDLQRLTNNDIREGMPVWSPDDSLLLYATMRNGNADICTLDLNTLTETLITNDPGYDSFPAWSPDGMQIAFVSERSGQRDIWIMDADGSNIVRITTNTAAETQPAWSPDGLRLAFSSERNSNRDVYLINIDGSGEVRLTEHPSYDASPAWSPDGNKLIFVTERLGPRQMYIMNQDGTVKTQLTYGYADKLGPAWSCLLPPQ